jgi:hypothetical protein
MKVVLAVFRAVFIFAGLLGVAMGAAVAIALAWAAGGGSGAGMVAYALVLFLPPIAVTLASIGFVGLLLTGLVAKRLEPKTDSI